MADFRKWGVEYTLDGKRWAIDVMATDEVDARRRLRQALVHGNVVGYEVARVWVGPQWLASVWQWLRARTHKLMGKHD